MCFFSSGGGGGGGVVRAIFEKGLWQLSLSLVVPVQIPRDSFPKIRPASGGDKKAANHRRCNTTLTDSFPHRWEPIDGR